MYVEQASRVITTKSGVSVEVSFCENENDNSLYLINIGKRSDGVPFLKKMRDGSTETLYGTDVESMSSLSIKSGNKEYTVDTSEITEKAKAAFLTYEPNFTYMWILSELPIRKEELTFSSKVYRTIEKLYGWSETDSIVSLRGKKILGKITNWLFYNRISGGLRQQLDFINPINFDKGKRKRKNYTHMKYMGYHLLQQMLQDFVVMGNKYGYKQIKSFLREWDKKYPTF